MSEKRSLLGRLVSRLFTRGKAAQACREPQGQARGGKSSVEKLLVEMKFGKR